MVSSPATQIFISNEKTLEDLEQPDDCQIIIDPSRNQGELLMSIDESDRDTARARAIALYPERSFCLLNEQQLVEQARWFTEHYLPEDPKAVIAYAIKANPRGRVLQLLQAGGIRYADCSNPVEIGQVQRFAPEMQALYAYPYKTRREIRKALQMGTRYFVIQSEKEAQKILEEAESEGVQESEVEMAVRIQTRNPKASIDLSQKFGIPLPQAAKVLKSIKNTTLIKLGIALNTGSQNRDPKSYLRAVGMATELAQAIGGVHSMNLGGGFPVNYHEGETFELEEYMKTLQKAAKEKIQDALIGETPMIIIEPGRALVAEAIELAIYIRGRIESPDGPAVVIDDGLFTSFIDALIHGWKYRFESETFTDITDFKLLGRTCDSGDSLKNKIPLPNTTNEGDYIYIKKSGAYLDSTSSIKFNGFLPPEYIAYNLMKDS